MSLQGSEEPLEGESATEAAFRQAAAVLKAKKEQDSLPFDQSLARYVISPVLTILLTLLNSHT